MNFSRALKGSLTRSGAIREIASQSHLELGRPLNNEEESALFQRFSPQTILDRIQRVNLNKAKTKVVNDMLFSMGLDPSNFCRFYAAALSSSVMFRRMLLPKMEIAYCMVFLVYQLLAISKSTILLAISDGILNNDALKNNEGDTTNETWTNLLREFGFYEDIDDHILYLRRRFVLGAAEWMAGGNGSKQNDKLLFEYTDSQWEYIWMTMLVDGAWAVPSIKDELGNIVKANDAPEILIKFIAHELKCHIIVFDLVLNRIQFLSGNHVKNNNVVFDSPLLIYSSGGHFQSVFQTDHEFFLNYAKQLDSENDSFDASANPANYQMNAESRENES